MKTNLKEIGLALLTLFAVSLAQAEDIESTSLCIISGEKLGSMGEPVTTEYRGKTISFCCSPCVDEFKADPESYLKPRSDDLALVPMPDQAVVKVTGLVCSFCAQGVRKNVSKLSFINKNKFDRGVYVDINAQGLVVALDKEKPVDLLGIKKSLEKGGYELVQIRLFLDGDIVHEGDDRLLVSSNGQRFLLQGELSVPLQEGAIQVLGSIVDPTGKWTVLQEPVSLLVENIYGVQ